MPSKRDYYEILGVPRESDPKELKRAYRKLALQYHPDKNPDPEASDRFKEISEAYAVLSDQEKRRRYDQFGHAGIDQQYSQEDIFRNADFGDIFGEGGLGDIFSRIFGGGFGGGFGGAQRGPRQGRTIEHPYAISLEDAFHGHRAEVDLRRQAVCQTCDGSGSKTGKTVTCQTCGGQGQVAQVQRTPFGVMQRVGACPACRGEGQTVRDPCEACRGEGRRPETQTLHIDIPAGVDDGMRLRIGGEGEAGPRGGPPGDLILFLQIKPHARFQRDGPDLHAELLVSMPRAALGGRVPFAGIDGALEVQVPPGVQSGKRLRITGEGMPRLRGGGRGDLLLRVQVETPARLNDRQRELFQELAEELGEAQPAGKKKRFVDRVVDAFKTE